MKVQTSGEVSRIIFKGDSVLIFALKADKEHEVKCTITSKKMDAAAKVEVGVKLKIKGEISLRQRTTKAGATIEENVFYVDEVEEK